MVFGFNLMSLVKAEVLKYKDAAGKPKVIGLLNELDSLVKVIGTFASKFNTTDVQALLNLMPRNVYNKFTQVEIDAFAAAVVNLPVLLGKLDAEIGTLEKELES